MLLQILEALPRAEPPMSSTSTSLVPSIHARRGPRRSNHSAATTPSSKSSRTAN
jgi:hypothetical protein